MSQQPDDTQTLAGTDINPTFPIALAVSFTVVVAPRFFDGLPIPAPAYDLLSALFGPVLVLTLVSGVFCWYTHRKNTA
jgi:hypothetical protein